MDAWHIFSHTPLDQLHKQRKTETLKYQQLTRSTLLTNNLILHTLSTLQNIRNDLEDGILAINHHAHNYLDKPDFDCDIHFDDIVNTNNMINDIENNDSATNNKFCKQETNEKYKEGFDLLIESWRKHRELQTFLSNKMEEQFHICNHQDTSNTNDSLPTEKTALLLLMKLMARKRKKPKKLKAKRMQMKIFVMKVYQHQCLF